jgi:hypothetical protein
MLLGYESYRTNSPDNAAYFGVIIVANGGTHGSPRWEEMIVPWSSCPQPSMILFQNPILQTEHFLSIYSRYLLSLERLFRRCLRGVQFSPAERQILCSFFRYPDLWVHVVVRVRSGHSKNVVVCPVLVFSVLNEWMVADSLWNAILTLTYWTGSAGYHFWVA